VALSENGSPGQRVRAKAVEGAIGHDRGRTLVAEDPGERLASDDSRIDSLFTHGHGSLLIGFWYHCAPRNKGLIVHIEETDDWLEFPGCC